MSEHPSTRADQRASRLAWITAAVAFAIFIGALGVWALEPGTGCNGGAAEFARIERVQSNAMVPTFLSGDLVFMQRRYYCRVEPKRGDLAEVAPPQGDTRPRILRIVAIPGDQVELSRGQLLLNGAPVERDWLESSINDESGEPRHASRFMEGLPDGPRYEMQVGELDGSSETMATLTVPPDHYFVLGDNRDSAADSRSFGTLARSQIVDRPLFVLWGESWARVGVRLP